MSEKIALPLKKLREGDKVSLTPFIKHVSIIIMPNLSMLS